MPQPTLNGIAVSSSGVALEHRASPLLQDDRIGGDFMGFGSVGIGLLAALALLAYWYRRVL